MASGTQFWILCDEVRVQCLRAVPKRFLEYFRRVQRQSPEIYEVIAVSNLLDHTQKEDQINIQ